MGKKPLAFTSINPQWIKGFTDYLHSRVSHNTVRCYLMDMFTALEDAVREEIIPTNPFRKIPPKDRIKKQDVFRQAFSLEDLQR